MYTCNTIRQSQQQLQVIKSEQMGGLCYKEEQSPFEKEANKWAEEAAKAVGGMSLMQKDRFKEVLKQEAIQPCHIFEEIADKFIGSDFDNKTIKYLPGFIAVFADYIRTKTLEKSIISAINFEYSEGKGRRVGEERTASSLH
eukprot:TRINITY_DN829_c0_g1_i1.p3 TRINITY_DN829_c0_g1~~TRINITY_DN829_c0_g1_i1.p3  ORF type:complete len:142 (-),score=14.62 TRINITY_DN829_c0_g1_i1:338-763(-)